MKKVESSSVLNIKSFHIISRGNNRNDVFHNTEDFENYLDVLRHYKQKMDFALWHYVLMTNHVHLVIAPGKEYTLADIMKGINQTIAAYHKKKYGISGHLWRNRPRRFLLTTYEYILNCGMYTELNPVRANMVSSPEKYPYSSYKTYAFGEENNLLEYDPAYRLIGKSDEARQVSYQALTDLWARRTKKHAKDFFRGKNV